MTLTVYYDKENKVVVAEPEGDATTENVKATIIKAYKLSKEYNCFLLLFDIRKCLQVQSSIEGFDLMSDINKNTGLSLKHKIAVVHDPALYPEKNARFVENVVVNRPNPSFKMFIEYQDALKWLVGNK